jgi:hypothetical protein
LSEPQALNKMIYNFEKWMKIGMTGRMTAIGSGELAQ